MAGRAFERVKNLFVRGDLFIAERTFAQLPASPHVGELANISNSSTATIGATISGGGANHVLARFGGTNWTVAAI